MGTDDSFFVCLSILNSKKMLRTDYIKKLKSKLVSVKDDVNKKLFEYQDIILRHMIEDKVRGLLLYWDVGFGKTIISTAVCEHYRRMGWEAIILSPKSLKENFVKSIRQYYRGELSPATIDKIIDSYKFASTNSINMIKQIKESKLQVSSETNFLNRKVIIVDEAHTIFNSIVNGAKAASEFYELIMNSKNIKILFLTGTPITKNFFEIVPALNMCNGYIQFDKVDSTRREKKNNRFSILPESYDDFVRFFVDEKKRVLINTEKFQNRIFGLVSYVGKFYTERHVPFKDNITQIIKRENFPDRLPIKILKVAMSPMQNSKYLEAREKEKKEVADSEKRRGGSIVKERNNLSSSYRIKSLQIGNILLDGARYDKIEDYSPKIHTLVDIVLNNFKGLHGLIYSNFITSGVEPVAKVLQYKGMYDYLDPNKPEGAKCFALFTGSIELEKRNEIVAVFNSLANRDGSKIELLLVSSVGEKGLNLKRIRHIHILEPNWSYTSTEQIIGRAIRYKSHDDLPEEERNVSIYQYISDYNKDYVKVFEPKEKTSDMTLFYSSIKQKELNDQFLILLAKTAIDCDNFIKNVNFNCYTCKPTDTLLYVPDLALDMKLPNPCKQIELEEVLIDGNKYYFTETLDSLYRKNEYDLYYPINDEEEKNKIKHNTTSI